MRRSLLALWAVLLLALGAVAAPTPASAAPEPGGQFLWGATAREVVVYNRNSPGEPVKTHPTMANGNMAEVNSQSAKLVVVPTLNGIDVFDADSGDYSFTYAGAAGGYRQVAAAPSPNSVGAPQIYGLRSDGTAIDIFGGDPSGPTGTITLPGTATYLSPSQTLQHQQILVNVKDSTGPLAYSFGVIDTRTNAVRYLDTMANQLVNGIAWSRDGAYAYVSAVNPDGTGGYIGKYTAANGSWTRVVLAPHQSARQVLVVDTILAKGVWVAAVDATTGRGSYQIVDPGTLSTVGSVDLGYWNQFGYGDVGQEDPLWMPPGPGGEWQALQQSNVADRTSQQVDQLGTTVPYPFLSVLVVDRPTRTTFVSGSGQKTFPGLPFAQPITVVVTDWAGQGLADEQVEISVTDNASITGWGPEALLLTDERGEVTLPPIVAGPDAGPVTVTADVGVLAPVTLPLTIVPAAVPPSVTALAAGDGEVTVTFDPGNGNGIAATGYTVTAYDSATGKPAGVTATGQGSPIRITGLTNGTSYTFTVTATYPVTTSTSAMSSAINAGIAASITGTPPAGEVGKPYTFTYTVTGAPAPTVAFDNDATPLPPGLTFDVTTATISGTPTRAGPFYVSVDATNAVGTSENDATIVINPATSLGGSEPTPTPPPTPSPTPSAPEPTPSAPSPSTGSGAPTPVHAGASPSGGPGVSSSAWSARGSSTFANQSSRPTSALAATGTPTLQLAVSATVLVLAGAGLLLLLRRPRRQDGPGAVTR